jgi:ABC-2 type transport system permease protein
MRTLGFLLRKEFSQIFRNKAIVAMILVLPVIQLLILPLAANYEVKNINLAVVDLDHSPYSQKLISKITASGYFKLTGYNDSFNKALEVIEADKADLVLEIPVGFEKNLVRENQQKLFIAVNAINGTKAGVGGAYLGSIVRDFNSEIIIESASTPANLPSAIEVVPANWYNQFMNYRNFMVPAILAILLTMVGGFLSALNIVKEKEIGTIEQINVTPIKKYHFILGKLIPFWVLGLVVFSLGLIVARVFYGITTEGSLLLLYGFIAIYLLAVLGFGLLISTFTETQQQAMLIAFFFMMIFILMGGLFTSIDSMPEWAKVISRFNPVSYMIDVMRMVMMKGSEFADIQYHLLKVAGFAIVLNTWAVWKYRKTA